MANSLQKCSGVTTGFVLNIWIMQLRIFMCLLHSQIGLQCLSCKYMRTFPIAIRLWPDLRWLLNLHLKTLFVHHCHLEHTHVSMASSERQGPTTVLASSNFRLIVVVINAITGFLSYILWHPACLKSHQNTTAKMQTLKEQLPKKSLRNACDELLNRCSRGAASENQAHKQGPEARPTKSAHKFGPLIRPTKSGPLGPLTRPTNSAH